MLHDGEHVLAGGDRPPGLGLGHRGHVHLLRQVPALGTVPVAEKLVEESA